jgi:DNA-directed RNA polymerase specialized sigma24 family protein
LFDEPHSLEQLGASPGELVALAKVVHGDVQRAMLALVPCVSLDDLDADEHPYVEEDLVTQLDVRRFVATLKRADQELVHSIFWEGVAAVEVARMQGVSASAISQRLARVYSLGRSYFAEVAVAA